MVGAFVGLALGDALGAPVEWMTAAEIAAVRPRGVREFLANPARGVSPGQVTDDTAMALVTAESLLSSRGLDMAELAARLVAWGTNRTDLGASTAGGIAALRAGTHWTLAGSDASPSSGCLPRCAPLALVLRGSQLRRASEDCCRVTHRHPLALAAVTAQNLLVARLLDADSPASAGPASSTGPEADGAWESVRDARELPPCVVDGAPAVLAEAFASVDQASSAEEALVAAVSLGGDSDTRGAVAGLLAGARWGFRAWPSRWIEGCPPTSDALRAATALAGAFGPSVPPESMSKKQWTAVDRR